MIVFLQHVPFETPGSIELWAKQKSLLSKIVKLYDDEPLPQLQDVSLLVVMGGPMSVHDENKFPFLTHEKRFIEKVIACNKKILGICLGAQLIADVLGAKVYKNNFREIGWFQVEKVVSENTLSNVLPTCFMAFHWHGETFDIPHKAVHIARSHACDNQGFIIGDTIVGLQFHLEITPIGVANLLQHCSEELDHSFYVQGADEIIAGTPYCAEINSLSDALLNALYC